MEKSEFEEENQTFDFMLPSRLNLDLLLGLNRKQTVRSVIIYLIQSIFAILILVIWYDLWQKLHFWWYFSLFIGIGAFIDQIIQPDENTKFEYYILLSLYYLVYKLVLLSLGAYLLILWFGISYEENFFEELLPILIVFVFWAIGQKVGFYIEHHELLSKVKKRGLQSLTDIDKLKIFLYQVNRRSFLRMMIERKKAKFKHYPSTPWDPTPEDFQLDTRLIYLNMQKFLKYLKITKLPVRTIVHFEQINEIDFSYNKIKSFSTSIFEIFPSVQLIDLSYNKIKSLNLDSDTELSKYFDGAVTINFEGNPYFI